MRRLSLAIVIFVSLSIAYPMPITGLGPPISEDEKIKVGEGVQILLGNFVSVFILVFS